MNRTGKSWVVALIIFAVSVVGALFPLPDALPQDSNNEVIFYIPKKTLEAVQDYWTQERMRNAQPLPLPKLSGLAFEVGSTALKGPSGPPMFVPSRHPDNFTSAPRNRTAELSEYPKAIDEAEKVEPLEGTYPFSFTRYRVFPDLRQVYKFFPYKVVGKVFFTIPGLGDYMCSGCVVNTTNRSAVWTAGHCVYSPDVGEGVWHENFIFVPARYNGVDLFGTWTANSLVTLDGWKNGLLEYDQGGAYMNRGGPGAGNHLVGKLGGLGFLANAPREQHWHLDGYPAEVPFDGDHQILCASSWATDDQPTGTPGVDPPTIGIGCDMTGGSSGGPWIVDFSGIPGVGNLLNGNVSYGYIGVPNELYGPYFSDGAINLYNWLASHPTP
jgi:V8-like Glu-specific endopeptidase